ncbi:two-component sensor histidine kinase BarA [Echinimonas agarilytica]|uniref:histidine kinase n=2 Tax=Echinimonas agarilytica TaxID=1215918 RepID=A0AA41W5C9_9GAMM|nr:two-component sensor histidine kinase BarA [Echinimonas agarilytica]
MILLTLTPTILVGLLLGSYFTVSRFQQIDDQIIDQGINLIEPLAIAAEHGLVTDSREHLMRLIGVTHRKHSPAIRSITVFDANHDIFVGSNFHRQFDTLRLTKGSTIPTQTSVNKIDGFIVLRAPILPDVARGNGKQQQPVGYIVIQLDRSSALLEQHRTAFYTFLIILAGTAICVLFTMRLVGKVTQPIVDMVQVIDKIRKGKLETRLAGNHIGELEDLKNGINAMAVSLTESQSELQHNIEQATGDLRETLEQIEIQNVELDLAKRRAQEAARVKTEFLANMSHELRTPLNGVLGFSRQLLKTQLGGPQRDQVLTIETSAQNLLGIINDILDLSKLEAGKLTLEQVPFILRDAIDETMQMLAPAAYQKSLDLAVVIENEVPDDLLGDSLRIKQVMTNLVGNAIKFTNAGSIEIEVQLEQIHGDQSSIKIGVRDTGVGISEEQQQALFQAFAQADASISRRFGGTGLGLVITKRLLQEMGGDIGLESAVGKGSYFWCTFTTRISPIALTDNRHPEEMIGKSVLLFEPQARAIESIEKPLHDWLMNVTPCRSSDQWLSLVSKSIQYDYVLMSIDHFDQQQLEHELNRLSQITRRAILMTAYSGNHNLENLTHYRDMHVNYLLKPVVSPRLIAALKHTFSQTTAMHDVAVLENTIASVRKPMKVLAVDDNPANLKLIVTLLKEKVSQVAMATSGDQAVLMAQKESFDIIFMDIQMPNTDGVTATQRIRQDTFNRSTPVVAVTAHALPEEKASLLSSGMDDYLTKPIEESLLDNILNHWHQAQNQSADALTFINHPLVDWPQALIQAGGRTELAKEMLSLLIASLPDSQRAINQAWLTKNLDELKAQVHRLHGACCYAGVPRLKQAAEQLETELKNSSAVSEAEPEYFELDDLLEQLISNPPNGLQDSKTTVASA